jgi:hypothetical protein
LRSLINILDSDRTFIKAGFAIWKILTTNRSLQLKFTHYLVKLAHNPNIKLSHWIKAYILYSKALYHNTRYRDAIQVLRNLLGVFFQIPLDEVRSLSEINKENRLQLTNVYLNYDCALEYYSSYTVYKKCEPIFLDNNSYDNRITDKSDDVTMSPIKRYARKNTEHTTSDNTQGQNNITSRITFELPSEHSRKSDVNISSDTKQLADLNIFSFKKLDEYIDTNLDKVEIPKINASIFIL